LCVLEQKVYKRIKKQTSSNLNQGKPEGYHVNRSSLAIAVAELKTVPISVAL